MKKYRTLLPILLAVLLVASWGVLIKDAVTVNVEYNTYLDAARKYAEQGIIKYAIENYNLALELKGSPEVYVEVADFYKAQGKDSEYLSWSENFFETYPTEPKAYDCVLGAYLNEQDYEACYDVLETAQKRSISTDYIQQVSSDIQYEYWLDFGSFDDVQTYSNNFCPVLKDGKWGFVDRYGNQKVACRYVKVGAYTQSAFAPVVNSNAEAYFIDKEGSKVMVSQEPYKSFGPLVNGMLAAVRGDGKYTYVNTDFQVLFGEYDYASTINENVGAVKTGTQWHIINEKGDLISNTVYADVKLDEKEIAFRNGRFFAAETQGQYKMYDASGKQVGSLAFEDAMPFADDAPAAVKINGRWCFVNAEGERLSENTYEGARSFSNGLAAVCIDGEWGFVDTNETVVIAPEFRNAKDFNEKGSCFVQTGDKWQLLKLYRLNREG